MDIAVLDLEWNGSYSRRIKGYINEIIEFGAVKCDEEMNVIDSFSCFVKPQVGKKISTIISNLTSITDENLVDGMTYMQAVSRFKKWAGSSLIMTWGTSDILALTENCRYFSSNGTVPFLTHYADLQKYAEDKIAADSKEQMGLQKAAELLEINMDEIEHHRALDDSMLSFEILKKIYDRENIAKFIEFCDDEFYKKITFKTAYVADLKNPMVKKSYLRFACPKCGAKSERITSWSLKNKGFRAEFKCSECAHPFAGRLIIKQKYEGLTVNKKTFPVAEIEKPREAKSADFREMYLEIADNVGILKFKSFKDIKMITHAFSTRIGGVSENEFAGMNLGFNRGDKDENVTENYELICKAMKLNSETLVAGAQDHHINIRRVGEENCGTGIWKPKDMESIDGLCTNESGVTLVVYAADCVPLYFVDEKHSAIGLAHAGWRGTAMGMAKAMIEKMNKEFGSEPKDIVAAIGPSICEDCFEVDKPVADEFLSLKNSDLFVEDSKNGKYHVDLWECNRQFLIEAGVDEENITVGEICSMCESDLIFSHRKTRGHRGSNAAFLAIN